MKFYRVNFSGKISYKMILLIENMRNKQGSIEKGRGVNQIIQWDRQILGFSSYNRGTQVSYRPILSSNLNGTNVHTAFYTIFLLLQTHLGKSHIAPIQKLMKVNEPLNTDKRLSASFSLVTANVYLKSFFFGTPYCKYDNTLNYFCTLKT